VEVTGQRARDEPAGARDHDQVVSLQPAVDLNGGVFFH
jgi:hypothetical protein